MQIEDNICTYIIDYIMVTTLLHINIKHSNTNQFAK